MPCGGAPKRGKTVCRLHGGSSPGGIAASNYQDGRHSKYLKHLPATFAAAFTPDDPHLVELREELALLDAHIVERLGHLQRGEAGAPNWSALRAAWQVFSQARDTRDGKAMLKAADALEALIVRGADQADHRAAIGTLIDQRGRLVAVESRRRKDEHDMVSADQFGMFARAALVAIAAEVTDRAARARIQEAIGRALALSLGPALVTRTAEVTG